MRPVLAIAAAAAFVSMASVFILKTYADAVFLGEYGAAYVPHFLVAQAVALGGISYGYGKLITRAKTFAFDVVILGAVVAFSAIAPILVRQGGVWVFGVSLGLIAGSALAQMAMWNAATSVVSGRAARAFLPQAGAAATAGAVIGGFGSTAIVSTASLGALAPVAGGLTLIALALRFFLRTGKVVRKVSAQMPTPARVPGEHRTVTRLVWLLAIATVVESLLSAVIDFGFKREVEAAFAGDENRMGFFLSIFYGTSNVMLLGVQLFAAPRLLATRSLKFNLGVQPVAQALAAALWVAVPILPLAAICRGLENVFKFGLARPAQEVALTPLRDVQRKRWKVLLRGVFGQGGGFVAGLVLIALAPLWALHPAMVPGFSVVLALLWIASQRRTAETYREALGSALGLKRRLEPEDGDTLVVDRDSMARVIELAGDRDPSTSRLAVELIDDLATDTRMLVAHIGTGGTEARRAVYQVLIDRPDRACLAALVRAVSSEADDSSALASGLLALAAHGDRSCLPRARALTRGHGPGHADACIEAAWFYRIACGDADEHRDLFFTELAARSGRRTAQLSALLIRSGQIEAGDIAERIITAIDGARSPQEAREGMFAAAHMGHSALLGRLLKALEDGAPGAEVAVAQLRGGALSELAAMLAERPISSRTQARFLRALRGLDEPQVSVVASAYLLAESFEVRSIAAHTLLSQVRRGHPRPPSRLVSAALDAQLDRFETYVNAKPGTQLQTRESAISLQVRNFSKGDISHEAFFLDELDRQTERCLSRLSDLLALIGEPSVVYAAERALKSESFKRRRQALDLLQETVSGAQRSRLLDLIERYLLPTSRPGPEAREAVCRIDPWLAKCAAETSERSRLLWTLRSAKVFDAAPGETIERLVDACEVHTYDEQVAIVEQGERGDAFYVIMDGAVAVERDRQLVAQLGAGESFGELSLIDDQPRGATVKVIQSCRALRLPAAPFRAALSKHPELGLGLVRGLVKMLRTQA